MEKEYRIKDSSEIEKVLKRKQQVSSKNITIYYKESETSHFRLAISVSKHIADAVKRNWQKRRVREIVRALRESLSQSDIFIICRNGSLELSFEELTTEINKLLKKANLL